MKFVTSFLSRHKVPRILLAIVGIAACVLFFRLSHVDMIGDDAHYSVRSIGPVDFMFGDLDAQSTPMQWFEVVPWWTHLSFHDHPKILFVIQHFFLLLHPTAFFAKLPYTLFALATIVLMFFFVRRMEAKSALASSLLLVLNAHFIWMGRVAYMESGVMFCVLLALYYFLRFEKNDQEWWKFGAAFGLALGVKFTTLFLVPAVLAYMVINKREYFKNIRFYGAAAIALVMQAPLFIYNLAMYARTGHFSLQFARLFHQPSPWHLAGAQVSLKGWMNMFMSVGQSISWVYLGVFLVSVGYLVCRKRRYTLLLSATLFFAIQQFFIGDSGYAVSVFAIFIAPIVALSFIDCKELLQNRCGATAVRGLKIAAVVFVAYLGVFVINSHMLSKHVGPLGILTSAASSYNFGGTQLDDYLDHLVATDPSITRLDPYGELKMKDSRSRPYLLKTDEQTLTESLANANIILFDDRINWFSRVWLFERRRFYYNVPVVSVAERALLEQIKIKSMYFIKAEDGAPIDSVTKNSPLSGVVEKQLISLGITPDLIYRDDGVLAFKVYHATNLDFKTK